MILIFKHKTMPRKVFTLNMYLMYRIAIKKYIFKLFNSLMFLFQYSWSLNVCS